MSFNGFLGLKKLLFPKKKKSDMQRNLSLLLKINSLRSEFWFLRWSFD